MTDPLLSVLDQAIKRATDAPLHLRPSEAMKAVLALRNVLADTRRRLSDLEKVHGTRQDHR